MAETENVGLFSPISSVLTVFTALEIQSRSTAIYDALCKSSDTAPESDCTRDKDWTGARIGGKLVITFQNRTELQHLERQVDAFDGVGY